VYDYLAKSPGHLSFAAGESLTITGGDQGGWLHARNGAGQSGWVPASYVDLGATAPTTSSGPRRAVLVADNPGGAFFARAGETVTITGSAQNGWCWATNAAGQSGWVAANVVRL
jgi:uncharacterized protein YgiM (DUF1202 family)